MTHLVLFASPGKPDSATVGKYKQALSTLGDYELRWIAIPGFSIVFKREARGMLKDGRYMPSILDKYADGRRDWDSISVIGYSAGCWMWRDGPFRSEQDRKLIDAAVMIDGAHATRPDELAAYHNYGRLGQLYILYTDVKTTGYNSTTQTVEKLREMGTPAQYIHRAPVAGETQRHQHARALTETGPGVVEQMAQWLAEQIPAKTLPAWQNPESSYVERVLAFSLNEVTRGNLETSGVNAGPRIARYFAPATRLKGGQEVKLGLKRGNWCAAGACYAATEALLPGEEMPHPYRVSGIELEQDAKRLGIWGPRGLYKPKPGDLRIMERGQPGGWERHVCRELYVNTGSSITVGANEGNSWQVTDRTFDDPRLLGWVIYPHEDEGIVVPRMKDFLAEGMWEDGMDEVQRLIDLLNEGDSG